MKAGQDIPAQAGKVLDFWFSLPRPGRSDDERIRKAWDGPHAQAAAGALDDWLAIPRARLALILLLDQAPRHIFRGEARSYATDNKAQEATRMFFVRPADWVDFIPRERYYAALPYLHAESPEKQRQVNPVIHYCAGEMESLSFMGRIADLYLETIQIFGRFPHRNALLGRQTTAAEAEFLEREWHPRRRREP